MTLWLTLRRSRYLIPVLLILLGAAFRLIDLGTVRHGYDESYQAYLALRLLDGGELLLIGQPSSVFLDNPPLMAYLQAIPLLFWRSPWAVYLFVTLLNSLATGFVYEGTRKVLGGAAAFLAAFLFAINPWLAYYSRLPWTQGLLPFFMAILAWGLWPTLVTDKPEPRRLFVALLAVTAMMQTYILAFALVVPVGILLVLFYRRLPRRPLWAGGAILVLSLLVYGVGLATRSEQNTAKFSNFVTSEAAGIKVEALQHALRFVTGQDFNGQEPNSPDQVAPSAGMVATQIFLSMVVLLGGVRAVLSLRKNAAAYRLSLTLLIWFGLPTMGLALLPTLVHPHYLLLTLPAGHVLAAWGLEWGWSRPQARWLFLIVLFLMAGQFWGNMKRAGDAVAAAPGASSSNGWALLQASQLGDEIRALTAETPHPQRIIAVDEAALLSGMSGVYLETIDGLTYPGFTVLPGQEPLLYLFVNQSRTPGFLVETEPDWMMQLVDGTTAELVRVLPVSRDKALALPQNPVVWTSDAGLTLLGYDLTWADDGPRTLLVTTYWRVEDLHPDRGAWFVSSFYHLLNEQGQIEVNVSPHGQWGYRWALGDVYVERIVLPLPDGSAPGNYELAIGLYDPIHGLSFMLNSASGRELFYRLPVENPSP